MPAIAPAHAAEAASTAEELPAIACMKDMKQIDVLL